MQTGEAEQEHLLIYRERGLEVGGQSVDQDAVGPVQDPADLGVVTYEIAQPKR